jgi:hypothetical protein
MKRKHVETLRFDSYAFSESTLTNAHATLSKLPNAIWTILIQFLGFDDIVLFDLMLINQRMRKVCFHIIPIFLRNNRVHTRQWNFWKQFSNSIIDIVCDEHFPVVAILNCCCNLKYLTAYQTSDFNVLIKSQSLQTLELRVRHARTISFDIPNVRDLTLLSSNIPIQSINTQNIQTIRWRILHRKDNFYDTIPCFLDVDWIHNCPSLQNLDIDAETCLQNIMYHVSKEITFLVKLGTLQNLPHVSLGNVKSIQ